MKRLRTVAACFVLAGGASGAGTLVVAAPNGVQVVADDTAKALTDGIARRKKMPNRELLPPAGAATPGSALGTTPGLSSPTVPPLGTLPPPLPVGPAVPQPIDKAPKRSIADCMKLWERATHMTKQEWRATCQRSIKAAEAADRANEAMVRAARKKRERAGK